MEILRKAGKDAAKSELIFSPQRTFLELERFDRIGEEGRRGIISIHALDLEYVGCVGNWKEIAKALLERRIIKPEWYDEILWRYYFGLCIGNTDMHSGNISFYAQGEILLGLAPIYDMLPMVLAPVHEQIMPIQFQPPALLPSDARIWKHAKVVAELFWENVQQDTRVGKAIKSVAEGWGL